MASPPKVNIIGNAEDFEQEEDNSDMQSVNSAFGGQLFGRNIQPRRQAQLSATKALQQVNDDSDDSFQDME